jgi:hypothetical protein
MARMSMFVLACVLGAAAPAKAQQPSPTATEAREHSAPAHADLGDPRSVLRLIVVYQARHAQMHGRYAASVQELGIPQPEPGLTIELSARGRDGYSAVVVMSNEECAVVHGRVDAPRGFTPRPDQVVCRPARSSR